MIGPLLDARTQVRCSWEGAPNASPSVVSLHGAPVGRNLFRNPRYLDVVEGVPRGFPSGNQSVLASVAQIPQIRGNALRLQGTATGSARYDRASVLGLEAGKTYTMRALLYLPEPLVEGTTESRSLSIGGFANRGISGYPTVAQAPNEAGLHELRGPLTLGDWTNQYLGFYQGGEGVTYWGEVLLVEGDYTGPFFDGDTTDPQTLISLYQAALH